MSAAKAKPRLLTFRRTTAAWRRHLACMMYLTGQHTLDTITQELKERYGIEVSIATVSNDISMMRQLYKDRAVETIEQMVDREVQKLDMLEDIAAERSQPSTYILGLDECDADVVSALEKAADEQSKRDDKYVDQMLKIQDRRSRLLGLDKPTRVELSGRDGAPIGVHQVSDADLERIAAGKAQRV